MHRYTRGALATGMAIGIAMLPNGPSKDPTVINISQEAFGPLSPDVVHDLPAVVAIEDPGAESQDGGDVVGSGLELRVDSTFGVLTAGHVLEDQDLNGRMRGVHKQNADGALDSCRPDVLMIGNRDTEGYDSQPIVASAGIAPITNAESQIISGLFGPDRALLEMRRPVGLSAVTLSQLGAAAFIGEHVVYANYQTMVSASGHFMERDPQYDDSRNQLALYGGVVLALTGEKAIVATNIGIRYTSQNPQDIGGYGLNVGGSGGPVFVTRSDGAAEVLGMSDASDNETYTVQQVDNFYNVDLKGASPEARIQITYINKINPGMVRSMQGDLRSCK